MILKVQESFIKSFVKYVAEKRGIDGSCYKVDVLKGNNFIFQVHTEWDKSFRNYEIKITKYVEVDECHQFQINVMRDVLIKEHKFDIDKYAEQNNIKFEDAFYLYAVLHELGHIKDMESKSIREMRMHDLLEENEYEKVYTLFRTNRYEGAYKYRLIPSEFNADKFAVECLQKHKRYISNRLSIDKKAVDNGIIM